MVSPSLSGDNKFILNRLNIKKIVLGDFTFYVNSVWCSSKLLSVPLFGDVGEAQL